MELGEATESEGIRLHDRSGTILIDATGVRNLAFTAGADVEQYLAGLEDLARREM